MTAENMQISELQQQMQRNTHTKHGGYVHVVPTELTHLLARRRARPFGARPKPGRRPGARTENRAAHRRCAGASVEGEHARPAVAAQHRAAAAAAVRLRPASP